MQNCHNCHSFQYISPTQRRRRFRSVAIVKSTIRWQLLPTLSTTFFFAHVTFAYRPFVALKGEPVRTGLGCVQADKAAWASGFARMISLADVDFRHIADLHVALHRHAPRWVLRHQGRCTWPRAAALAPAAPLVRRGRGHPHTDPPVWRSPHERNRRASAELHRGRLVVCCPRGLSATAAHQNLAHSRIVVSCHVRSGHRGS